MTIRFAMFIDDEELDRMLYDRIARRSGLVGRMQSFALAEEALAYLEAHPGDRPDAIFLDINMPRMNGLEFIDAATVRLGPDFAGLCAVMLTTPLPPEDRARAEAHGIVRAFFDKPLRVAQLEEVSALLEEGRGPPFSLRRDSRTSPPAPGR